MDNLVFTKGDSNEVLKRVGNVHTITVYCPLKYNDMQMLQSSLMVFLSPYRLENDNTRWGDIPTIDVLRVFLFIMHSYDNIDLGHIKIVSGLLKYFYKLKYVNFEFVDSDDYDNDYDSMTKDFHNIFKINKLELNLSDMFAQGIIDLFNKILIMNDIILNSYLGRSFLINFKFDEYVSFVKMMLNNNEDSFDSMDENIIKYFDVFPQVIQDHKPDIRVITNYAEL